MIRIILISLLLSCTSTQGKDTLFKSYLEGFTKYNLPLDVNRENIFSYNEMIYDTSTDRHISNVYLNIDTTFYKLFKSKSGTNYRYLYQFDSEKDYKVVVILEDYLLDDDINGMWFHLYTYKDEKIVDDVVIGGYEVDNKEQFFTIDKDLNIISTLFEFLQSPDGDDNYMYAKRIINKYNITDTGNIIRQSTTEKEAKFDMTKTGYVEIN
jgi:hypothetical protein